MRREGCFELTTIYKRGRGEEKERYQGLGYRSSREATCGYGKQHLKEYLEKLC